MRPQNPKPSNLSWEQRKLLLYSIQDGTRTSITGKERRRILTFYWIERIARNRMSEKTAMDV
jgi:hypothetical protein